MWLEAEILESGEKYETIKGTPQGAGVGPLLANVFLHYILDLWVHQWRRRRARGRVTIVRYAGGDFVMGFEREADAKQMLADLKERLAKFGLLLHEDKTRLIKLGSLRGHDPTKAWRSASGDLRLPWLHALLRLTLGTTRLVIIDRDKGQSNRLTRKLKALQQEAWPQHAPDHWPSSTAGTPAYPSGTTATSACRTTGAPSTGSYEQNPADLVQLPPAALLPGRPVGEMTVPGSIRRSRSPLSTTIKPSHLNRRNSSGHAMTL